MIRSLRTIVVHSLLHAVRTRVFLLVSVGTLLLLFANLEGYGLVSGDRGEDSVQRVERTLRTSGAEDLLSLWVEAAALAGLFLGATAVSSDLRSRTLEAVLTRPVPKPLYLVGRWAGLQLLVLGFSAAGVTLSFAVLPLSELEPSPLLWLGLAQLVVTAMLVITLGMAFGARWHPVSAGVLAVLLITLPSLLSPYLDHPAGLIRWIARLIYFAGPAVPQQNLITDAFSQSPLTSMSYELPLLVIVENCFYGLAALAAGCILFQRREIRPCRE